MFEQDYIMRIIKEVVRAILKLLFHIDIESPSAELIKDQQCRATLDNLLEMVDRGQINEAENILYDLTSTGDMQNLQVALLFYSYLNDKEESYLSEHNFSHEEVKNGLTDLTARYGLENIKDIFMATACEPYPKAVKVSLQPAFIL